MQAAAAQGLTVKAVGAGHSFTGIAVDSSYGELLPGFMLLGIGIAMTMSPMTSAAMNAVPVEKAGIASGVLSMFRMIGGSLGVAVTGAIFQGAVGTANFAEAGPQDFVDGLSKAMAVSCAVALAGAVFAAFTIRAKRKSLTQPETEEVLAMSSDPAGQVEAASQV